MKKLILKKGIYEHYKNKKKYDVLSIALHTESEENLVIYKPLYKSEHKLFARPYNMFFEKVKDPETGIFVPRFKYIKKH